MSIFKQSNMSNRLFLFVTAVDQTVIARPNMKIQENVWSQLPDFQSKTGDDHKFIIDSFVFRDLQNILLETKYSPLFKKRENEERVLEKIGNIQLPLAYFKELEWLKRLDYYYHHTLAVLILITFYGIEIQLRDEDLKILIKAVLIRDIGVSRLPYSLLFSDSFFNQKEQNIVRQHPIISYLLIGYYSRKEDLNIGNIVLSHHSPCIVSQDNCKNSNWYVWLLYLADVFDALTSNRPFRPAYKITNAIFYLKHSTESIGVSKDFIKWLELNYKSYDFNQSFQQFSSFCPRLHSQQFN